jgi:hypothetical protein
MRLPLLVLIAGSLLTAGCAGEGDGDSAAKSKPASTATPGEDRRRDERERVGGGGQRGLQGQPEADG